MRTFHGDSCAGGARQADFHEAVFEGMRQHIEDVIVEHNLPESVAVALMEVIARREVTPAQAE
jgi:hypothetical protein